MFENLSVFSGEGEPEDVKLKPGIGLRDTGDTGQCFSRWSHPILLTNTDAKSNTNLQLILVKSFV